MKKWGIFVPAAQHVAFLPWKILFFGTVIEYLLEDLLSIPSKAGIYAYLWIAIHVSGYLKIKQSERDTMSSLRTFLSCCTCPHSAVFRQSMSIICTPNMWVLKLTVNLGAFAKLRKSIISFYPVSSSVCQSAWNNSAPTRRIFIKFDIWVLFGKLSRKIQVSLKSDKNNRYFT